MPGNPPNTASIEEGEKESISGVENNRGGGRCRGDRTISAVPGEGGGRRRLSSAALRCFRFSEGPVCFATRGEPRGLHVYQREGRCRILIASHVIVAVSVVDRVPRRKVIREYVRSGGTGGNKEEAVRTRQSRERERRPAMQMVQGRA